MNRTIYNRATHEVKKSIIPNVPLNDSRLNSVERGIMLEIMADDVKYFAMDKDHYFKKSGLGAGQFAKVWNKLERLGYLVPMGDVWGVNPFAGMEAGNE